MLMVEPPEGGPIIVPEAYDGDSDDWIALPMEERLDDLLSSQNIVNPGYDWTTDGVAFWAVDTGILWQQRSGSPTFPEPSASSLPPDSRQRFWVRLVNTGTVALIIDRLLPCYYNTYTTAIAVARYIAQRDFDDADQPFLDSVRERIHNQEDIIDNFMRKSFRTRMAINERHEFNAWGVRLDYWPVTELTGVHIWSGTSYQPLMVGRNQDVYVDPGKGMLYFTRLALGRGIPWSRPSIAWMRQPDALLVSYIYGGDFDLAPVRGIIRDIVIKRTAASLAVVDGETAYFPNARDLVTKPEQVAIWTDSANELADQLRGVFAA